MLLIAVVVIIENSIGKIESTKNLMMMLTPEFNLTIEFRKIFGLVLYMGFSFGGIIVAIVFPGEI
jgi:hypothetical protein